MGYIKHKTQIFELILTCYLLFILLTQSSGISSAESNNNLSVENSKERHSTEEWESPSEDLPFPNVHSPVYLIQLAKYEAFVNSALWNLVENHSRLFQSMLLTKINDYLLFYTEDVAAELASQVHYAENFSPDDRARIVGQNPILSLNMIWRFANQLSLIHELIQEEPYISLVTNGPEEDFIRDVEAIVKWPNEKTLEDAMKGFLRIQMVYDLDVTELSAGRIFGQNIGPPMILPVMHSLAKYASTNEMYNLAIPWLELIWDKLYLQQLMPEEERFDVSQNEVVGLLMSTMMEHDMKRGRGVWNFYVFKHKLLNEDQTFVEERFPVRKQDWTYVQRLNGSFSEINYWSLCSGDNHQTEEEKAVLTCWYDRTTHPALYISPVKKELLSSFPYVVHMYDVISESTIKKLQFQANMQNQVRSKVQLPMEGKSKIEDMIRSTSDFRTSVETWLDDPPPNLNRFVEASTGLSVIQPNSSEPYHLVSYAFGGHYDCHLDAYGKHESPGPAGNRIATMMFYLDEPQIGGRTAFPQAGIAVKPVRGSAVFWYGLKRNGEIDEDTYHCACPVVLGHKTIATKWIRSSNQFQRRPCDLNQNE